MCGINGVFGLEHTSDPISLIQKMNSTIAHRGPDNDGVFYEGNVALGHRRLSIIDLSDVSNQPFISQDSRYVIVFNGEIYNFNSIKKQLPDYNFISQGDTEVVLAAYIAFGDDCFSMFNGMFALAIWDKQDQILTLARDRMGIKPLYYHQSTQSLCFSSEIRALIHSGAVSPKLDKNSLVDYMRYQTVHAPNTIIEGVKMLMPGKIMKIRDSETEIKTFWDIREDYIDNSSIDYNTVKSNISDLLFQSVEARTVSDVPYGAFLSGGIDSSAIVGMMSKINDVQINTFSVVFDDSEFSEAVYARQIAKKFGTIHKEIPVTPDDFLELLPDALKAMDHPSADGPNTFVVSKVTKDSGVTMALSGLGGDELFAGYELFKRCVSLSDKKWLTSFPRYVREPFSKMYSKIKPSIKSEKIAATLSLDYFDLEYIYPLMRQVFQDDKILKLTGFDNLIENQVHNIAQGVGYDSNKSSMPYLSRISYMEMNTYMQNILLRDSDQMSMAHALEIRVPFLDHRLVEYVIGVSDKLKYPSSPKKLLVDSLGNLLPDEIVNRPKMGFTFPWSKWMKKELRSFCEENISRMKDRSYIDSAEIEKLWQAFLDDKPSVNWSRLWGLIVLENWLNENNVQA